jgi:hypothetical protein
MKPLQGANQSHALWNWFLYFPKRLETIPSFKMKDGIHQALVRFPPLLKRIALIIVSIKLNLNVSLKIHSLYNGLGLGAVPTMTSQRFIKLGFEFLS